jgi:hypothetical protein
MIKNEKFEIDYLPFCRTAAYCPSLLLAGGVAARLFLLPTLCFELRDSSSLE